MSHHDIADNQRIDDLLADHAMQGLSRSEQDELRSLLTRCEGGVEAEALEHCAAAVSLACGVSIEPMPEHLRVRVKADAEQWLDRIRLITSRIRPRDRRTAGSDNSADPDRESDTPVIGLVGPDSSGTAGHTTRSNIIPPAIPWLAAAAAIVLALLGWIPALRTDSTTIPPERLSIAEQVAQLLGESETIVVKWPDNALGVEGDLVWNPRAQQGYMRLAGLPANDPALLQYQLWIFDADRREYSQFNAVDGGVFDVRVEGQQVIVPVHAKLKVFNPELFAITTEPPGGVIKHNPEADPDQFKIILAAPVTEG